MSIPISPPPLKLYLTLCPSCITTIEPRLKAFNSLNRLKLKPVLTVCNRYFSTRNKRSGSADIAGIDSISKAITESAG